MVFSNFWKPSQLPNVNNRLCDDVVKNQQRTGCPEFANTAFPMLHVVSIPDLASLVDLRLCISVAQACRQSPDGIAVTSSKLVINPSATEAIYQLI